MTISLCDKLEKRPRETIGWQCTCIQVDEKNWNVLLTATAISISRLCRCRHCGKNKWKLKKSLVSDWNCRKGTWSYYENEKQRKNNHEASINRDIQTDSIYILSKWKQKFMKLPWIQTSKLMAFTIMTKTLVFEDIHLNNQKAWQDYNVLPTLPSSALTQKQKSYINFLSLHGRKQ